MIHYFSNKITSLFSKLSKQLSGIFAKTSLSDDSYLELETILLQADVGSKTTAFLIEQIKKQNPQDGLQLKQLLAKELTSILSSDRTSLYDADVILLVGINGSGKTTAISKLALRAQQQNKKVLLVAGDTFRAAAQEQLVNWAERLGIDCITGKQGQEAASVIWQGCEQFTQGAYDQLIIDTAGRLQTKTNLMNELAKIKRTITKLLPDKKLLTFLTLDSMLGQNSFDQARLFHECTSIDGIIMTKMDGTGKGGILIAIEHDLRIPVVYISFGEQPDALSIFDPQEYITTLLDI